MDVLAAGITGLNAEVFETGSCVVGEISFIIFSTCGATASAEAPLMEAKAKNRLSLSRWHLLIR